MFKVRRIWSHNLSVKNLVLLFFTIVLGFASVITLAQVNIVSNIDNARQTIGRITITNNWTDGGIKYFDFNYSGNGKTYINPDIFPLLSSFSWRVLWINDQWELIYVLSSGLVMSWSTTIIAWSGDDDWTIVGNNIYRYTGNVGIGNPQIISGKLHIVNTDNIPADIYIEEKGAWMAANIHFDNPLRTWTIWADSLPDIFYIGIPGLPQFFSINPSWDIGIGTTDPQEKLEISGGNVRINNVPNKIVLGTDSNGKIIGSTSGSVYNFISGFALSWPRGATWATWGSVGDDLWNHTAETDLVMWPYRISYDTFTPWLHILSDWRVETFSTIQIWNSASALSCDTYNKGTMKYIPNCFQWCNWTNRITLWWTCVGLPAVCWDNTVTSPEQCDDGNGNNNDWCVACQRETPTCNFTMSPTTWNIPLPVTFQWISTSRAVYTLMFGNWYGLYDVTSFSWQQYTYQTIGNFIPTLIAKNKNHVSTQTTCYAWWSTTWIITSANCWDGIINAPEQCDDGNGNNNDWCVACQRETPTTCTISATPNTWEVPLLVNFTWTDESRASYRVNFWDWTTSYQSIFSGSIHTYQNIWVFTAALVVYNKNDTAKKSLPCYTAITINAHCWDGIVNAPEQCDDGNGNNNDWCVSCQREMPTCDFTMSPTTWNIPLPVTFQWTEQNRTIYGLRFGNGQGISNQTEFSWTTYTYQSTGTVVPHLTVKNKYNLATETGCEAWWSTTSITTTETKEYCGDGIVQTPNGSGDYEQCDLWSWINSSTWMCWTDCTYNIPECAIFASPSVFTGGSWEATFTWTISPRANYIVRVIAPNGTQTTHRYSEFKLRTEFEITGRYDTLGTYTINLISNDGQWASCSTTVNVYGNGAYACGIAHNSDEKILNEANQWLCAQWYKASDFSGHTETIINVIGKSDNTKVAILFTDSEFGTRPTYNYIDIFKDMVRYSWSEYIIHHTRLWLTEFVSWTVLLPEQWYKYRTRNCIDMNNSGQTVSSCYAHKKIDGNCAYDMNLDDSSLTQKLTTWQIANAILNSWKLLKCKLYEPFWDTEYGNIKQYKYTRWLPLENEKWGAACELLNTPLEQSIFYIHRVCPGYNYWEQSESCDAIYRTGFNVNSCQDLWENLYWSLWNTGSIGIEKN